MKDLVSLLLLLSMLVAIFASCEVKDEISDITSDVSAEDSEESGDGRYVADVPYKDYGGREIKILTTSTGPNPQITEFGFGEELSDSPINDAVEERNNKVEELLGVKVIEELVADGQRSVGGIVRERVLLALTTGDDDFHLVVPSLFNCGALASEGGLYDLNDFEYLHNLSAPWWSQNFIEDLTIDGRMFFTTGDIGIGTREAITVCYFNKTLFKNYDLDDPYELVKENKWTIDKLIELSRTVKQDLNDDGKIDHRDSFGLGGQLDLAWALFYGSGERIASKGNDGFPSLSIYNNRSVGVMDKMLDLMANDDYFVNANHLFEFSDTPVDLVTDAFLAGRCLVFCEGIDKVSWLREMADMEFGILPIPLYDENQNGYQHMVNPWTGSAIGIPRYLEKEDAEFAAIVLEVLGAESKNYITPVTYDRALKWQAVHDEESQEMLDIIFDGIGADMGHIYDWGNLGSKIIHGLIFDKKIGQFKSEFEKYEDVAEAALQKTVDAFKEIE